MNHSTTKKFALALLLASAGAAHKIHADSSIIKGVLTGAGSFVIGAIEGKATATLEDDIINDVHKEDRSVWKRMLLWGPPATARIITAALLSFGNLPNNPFPKNELSLHPKLIAEAAKNIVVAQLSSWLAYGIAKHNQAARLAPVRR